MRLRSRKKFERKVQLFPSLDSVGGKGAVHMNVKMYLWHSITVPGVYSKVHVLIQLLAQTVDLFSVFSGSPELFSMAAALFLTVQQCGGSRFSTDSPAPVCFLCCVEIGTL